MIPIALMFDFGQSFTRGVLRGIEHFAHSRPDWTLLFCDSRSTTRAEVRRMAPAGVIAHVVSPALARVLERQNCPVVNTSFMIPDAPFPRVGVDNQVVGQTAYGHLRERGFASFGLVGDLGQRYSDERADGFRELMEPSFPFSAFYRAGTAKASWAVPPLDSSPQLIRWLKSLQKPVGIFTCRGVWGIQVIESCRVAGLGVPEDVGVVCVDDDELLCELSRPSLTSVIVPSERIGAEAAKLLDDMLTEQSRRTRRRRTRNHAIHLVSPSRFIVRASSDVYAGCHPDVVRALRFIQENAHRSIRVADVLKSIGLERRTLEQRFHKHLDRGIGEEIRRVRLECTKRLLTGTDLPLVEVASRAGFSSVYYLSREFKRQTGETPSAYRRRLRFPGQT